MDNKLKALGLLGLLMAGGVRGMDDDVDWESKKLPFVYELPNVLGVDEKESFVEKMKTLLIAGPKKRDSNGDVREGSLRDDSSSANLAIDEFLKFLALENFDLWMVLNRQYQLKNDGFQGRMRSGYVLNGPKFFTDLFDGMERNRNYEVARRRVLMQVYEAMESPNPKQALRDLVDRFHYGTAVEWLAYKALTRFAIGDAANLLPSIYRGHSKKGLDDNTFNTIVLDGMEEAKQYRAEYEAMMKMQE